MELLVGDGSKVAVYLHKITIELAGKIFEARIGFSKHVRIGFNVIGRKDVFEKFKITFNEKEKYIDFIEV